MKKKAKTEPIKTPDGYRIEVKEWEGLQGKKKSISVYYKGIEIYDGHSTVKSIPAARALIKKHQSTHNPKPKTPMRDMRKVKRKKTCKRVTVKRHTRRCPKILK